jgi:hypothetical protein
MVLCATYFVGDHHLPWQHCCRNIVKADPPTSHAAGVSVDFKIYRIGQKENVRIFDLVQLASRDTWQTIDTMWKGFAQLMVDVHFDASNQATIARAARKRKSFDDDSYNSWSVEESAVGPSRDESAVLCVSTR